MSESVVPMPMPMPVAAVSEGHRGEGRRTMAPLAPGLHEAEGDEGTGTAEREGGGAGRGQVEEGNIAGETLDRGGGGNRDADMQAVGHCLDAGAPEARTCTPQHQLKQWPLTLPCGADGCQLSFPSASLLRQHRARSHRQRCRVCSRWVAPERLARHVRDHLQRPPAHACSHEGCGRRYSSVRGGGGRGSERQCKGASDSRVS